ncbi:MAG TPA: hypothetical protein VF771_21910, partial [Longimicrobiaceae bacterium]
MTRESRESSGRVRRSRWAFWRVPVAQVVDDELAFHLEMQTRRYVEGGDGPRGGARAGAAPLRRRRAGARRVP